MTRRANWRWLSSKQYAVRSRHVNKETEMKHKKTQDPKKNVTLRPWLVDVVIDNLR